MATNEVLDGGIRAVNGWVAVGDGTFQRATTDGTENSDSIEISATTSSNGARLDGPGVIRPQPHPRDLREIAFDARMVAGEPSWECYVIMFSATNAVLGTIGIATLQLLAGWKRYRLRVRPTHPDTAYITFGLRRPVGPAVLSTARFDQLSLRLLLPAPRILDLAGVQPTIGGE